MHLRPQLTVASVAVLWGSIGVIVREVPLPAVAIVAGRLWVAAVALGVWVWLRRWRRVGPRLLTFRPGRTVAAGVVLALHWMALFAALKRAPIGTVLFITYLAPVGVAVLAPAVLGERVGRRTVVALVLGVAGIALMAAPDLDAAGAGLALAAVAASLYVVLMLVAKPLSEVYGGVRLAFVQMTVAGIVLVPFAATAGWGAPRASWAWLLVLGLVHTALAVGLFLGALARLPATQVGILAYLEPVSAVAFGWGLLAEVPTLVTGAGGALAVAAGVLVATARPMPIAPEVPAATPPGGAPGVAAKEGPRGTAR